LTPDEMRRADGEDGFTADTRLADGQPLRILARGVDAQNGHFVIVIGASLKARAQSLSDLKELLWEGGLIGLLFASLTGYGLATAALRPIEQMRRRAAGITIGDLDRRLPVPAAHDEVGRLGATLNDMLDRLETAIDKERDFIADASHELRTPLALLRTEIDLALRGNKTADDLDRALRSAGDEVERLSRLADALLLFARLDRGALALSLEELDLVATVGFVRTRTESRALRLGREVAIDVPTGMRLTADRLRLEQALDNLIDNALRYGSGTVRISAAVEPHATMIEVSDEGQGFPEEFIPRAFERFSRAETGAGMGGSGVGLAIVAAVARAHGGSAGVTNLTGGGACVWLRLPQPPVVASAEND